MSQENVEIVERALNAAQEDPEAFFSIFDQNVEWDMSGAGLPDAKTYHGPEGVREFFRGWIGPFDDFDYEAEEVIDAGDSVIVLLHQWGRGKGSGVLVESRFWQVWTLRDGKVVRFKNFPERGQALEAPGLSEQDAHADS
jgi:ketosteroid isomerase-like protein